MVVDDRESGSSKIRRDDAKAELTHSRENGSVTSNDATPSHGTKPVIEDDSPFDDSVIKQASLETVLKLEVSV